MNQNRRDFMRSSLLGGSGFLLGCTTGKATQAELTIFDVIHKRRSVRKFLPTPVPQEHVEKILDAARMAPTAGNQQPWKFLVIRDRARIDDLKEACIERSLAMAKQRGNPTEEQLEEGRKRAAEYYTNILSAPVYVVVLTDNESKYPTYSVHDGPLAVANLMLAARALGYGTVYFTDSISQEVTKEVFNIPDRYTRICITPIGIPEAWPETPDKKPLEEFIAYESI